MNDREWLNTALAGAAIGAIAAMSIGFTWGGWVTGVTARNMASAEGQARFVAALAPICVTQSKQDPRFAQMLTTLKDTASYQRREMVMAAGWATMPGSSEPDRAVASACTETLAGQF